MGLRSWWQRVLQGDVVLPTQRKLKVIDQYHSSSTHCSQCGERYPPSNAAAHTCKPKYPDKTSGYNPPSILDPLNPFSLLNPVSEVFVPDVSNIDTTSSFDSFGGGESGGGGADGSF